MTAPRELLPYQPLTLRAIPRIANDQLRRFHYDTLAIRKTDQGFSTEILRRVLQQSEGQEVWGVSIDAEQLVAVPFHVQEGQLVADTDRINSVASEGSGIHYFPLLETISKGTQLDRPPVGVATAGLLRNTELLAFPELPDFRRELRREFDADFQYIFPTLAAVQNISQASVKTAALQAETDFEQKRGMLFVSNGFDSFHGGVIKDGMVFAMDPGQVPAIDEAYDSDVNHLATGRHLKEQLTHTQDSNEQQAIFDDSANLTATAIAGMARSVWLLQGENDTTIALDGSTFAYASYGLRVMQILSQNLGFEPPFFFTAPLSPNIAAEGAAIAALVSLAIQKARSSKPKHS